MNKNRTSPQPAPDAATLVYLVHRVSQDPAVRLAWRRATDDALAFRESPTMAFNSVVNAMTVTTASWQRHGGKPPLAFT